MEKIQKFINKYGLMIMLILTTFIFIRGCGVNGDRELESKVTNKKIDSLSTVVNTLIEGDMVNNSELKKTIKIEGLKTEKRTLINTNNIFLTNKRPDNRYSEIDKEIELIENGELVN